MASRPALVSVGETRRAFREGANSGCVIAEEDAMELLKRAEGHVKVAIVMQKAGVELSEAKQRLDSTKGRLRDALRE